MIIGKEECGCEIWQDNEFAHIEYCKKHQAVDDLYEALKVANEYLQYGNSSYEDSEKAQVDKALAESK